MEEELKRLLTARPTSAGAFGIRQIELGHDANAIKQYYEGIRNPGAAPQIEESVSQPQPASAPVQQAFDVPVYTQNWDKPIPPIVIRFPEGFNPEDPRHIAAEQKAYAEAYDEKNQGVYALKLLNDLRSKEQTIKSASEAVAKYSQDVQRLEAKKQRGVVELPTEDGMVRLPMDAKSSAENLQKLGETKEKLKTAEQKLKEAKEPARPTEIKVELPAAQPPQQPQETEAQAPQEQKLPSAKEELDGITDYPQDKWYRESMAEIYDWGTRAHAIPGVNHSAVDARIKMLENRVNSQWVPEHRYMNGKVWRYDAPNKAVEASDPAGAVKGIFEAHAKKATELISGTEQLDEMIRQAYEAADPKTPKEKRNTLILGLQNSFKAITSAISGTSDAVQQQEFNRANAPLDALNVFKSLVDPTSTAKFMQANPTGFAKGLEGVRNIAARKVLEQYNGALRIHEDFPQVYRKSALPELPKYMQDIRNSLKQQVIQKNAAGQQQAPPIITRQGTQFTKVPR